jgi:carboxyvinyl-carboxyphosphonate phosphorylmutase
LKAAVAARGASGPLVLGRTSATTVSGVDDAIARLTAYEAVGVDALMVPALRSREDLDRISAATHLPLVVGGMPLSMCEPAYLEARRARLWSSGHQTVNVGIQALYDAMKAVHEGALAPSLPGVAGKETMSAITNERDYEARLRLFLSPQSASA